MRIKGFVSPGATAQYMADTAPAIEDGEHRGLGDAGHGAPAMMSSTAPSGELARPWLSRSRAWRITSMVMPCCSAIEQTTAASLAAESLCEPALAFDMKISASRPSGKREMVARQAVARERKRFGKSAVRQTLAGGIHA